MESGSTEWCAMELAKDNFYHNIPKDWITAKVWDVLCKNPVYKDYVKENARYVNKKVTQKCEKTVDKPKKINYINNTNETTTNNSKGETTMENKINELLTLVKHLNARIESLELGNRPQLKKLRENKEEAPKKTVENIVKKTAEKTAVISEKQELMKLQKKARLQEQNLTKKQMGEYTKLISEQWHIINKKIGKADKAARSMAFVKARFSCLKKVRAI